MLKSIHSNTLVRWFVSVVVSYVVYNLLWLFVRVQFSEWVIDTIDVLWDLVCCIIFTSISFIVCWGVDKICHHKLYESALSILVTLALNSALISILDHIFDSTFQIEYDIFDVMNLYIICAISSLLSILNIQHSYYQEYKRMKAEQDKLRLNLLQHLNERYKLLTGKELTINNRDNYFIIGIPLINHHESTNNRG